MTKEMIQFKISNKNLWMEMTKEIMFVMLATGSGIWAFIVILQDLKQLSDEPVKRVLGICMAGIVLAMCLYFLVFFLIQLLLDNGRKGLSFYVSDKNIVFLRKQKEYLVSESNLINILDQMFEVSFIFFVDGRPFTLAIMKKYFEPTICQTMSQELKKLKGYTNDEREINRIADNYKTAKLFRTNCFEFRLGK